jgi:hypothetical protein
LLRDFDLAGLDDEHFIPKVSLVKNDIVRVIGSPAFVKNLLFAAHGILGVKNKDTGRF